MTCDCCSNVIEYNKCSLRSMTKERKGINLKDGNFVSVEVKISCRNVTVTWEKLQELDRRWSRKQEQ